MTGAGDPPTTSPFAQNVYLVCAATSVTALLVADFIGPKFFDYGHVLGWRLQHSVGMLTFPLTFLITDVVNEYYGARGARRIAYVSLAMGALAYLALLAAQALPATTERIGVTQEQFDAVFGQARQIYLASLAAYFAGQLFDILVFRLLKRLTGDRLLWLRATGSTVVSQMVDSLVITTIFLWSQGAAEFTWEKVFEIARTGYVLKFLLAIGTTPLIYLAHALLRPRLRPR